MDRTVGESVGYAAVLRALLVLVATGTFGVGTGGVAAQATTETYVSYHENPETVAEQGDSRSWSNPQIGQTTLEEPTKTDRARSVGQDTEIK